MSAKAIREATGKDLINRKLAVGTNAAKCRFVSIDETTNWGTLAADYPWLKTEKLVVKPDQLIKRRGKLGLIKVNADFATCKQWVLERMNKDQKVEKATGKLRNFIIEPFVPHAPVNKKFIANLLHIYLLRIYLLKIYCKFIANLLIANVLRIYLL